MGSPARAGSSIPKEPCHPAECSEHEWQTDIRRRVADECQRGKDEGLTPDAARLCVRVVYLCSLVAHRDEEVVWDEEFCGEGP